MSPFVARARGRKEVCERAEEKADVLAGRVDMWAANAKSTRAVADEEENCEGA